MEKNIPLSGYKILVCDKVDEILLNGLTSRGLSVEYDPDISPEELLKRIVEFHAVVVRSRTKITSTVIDRAINLKIIARAGVGVDNIDVKSAHKKGIKVITAAGSSTDSVVELALSLAIDLARYILELTTETRKGIFHKKTGNELHSKTTGIIGLGRIGFQTATVLKALGMSVIAYDLIQSQERIDAVSGRYVSLHELVSTSDFMFVMVTMEHDAGPVLNEAEFALMKKNAIIINTSRAEAIHGPSLLSYLKQNQSAAYGTDVLLNEPPMEDWEKELITLHNVLATPHIGAQTVEAQQRIATITLERILETIQVG